MTLKGEPERGGSAQWSRRGIVLGVGAFGAVSATGCAHVSLPAKTMALTFDDLPYVAQSLPGALSDAQRVTTALTRALRRHRAPSVGFVNEDRVIVAGEVEARTALLRVWMESGATLANHSFSHMDYNTASVAAFSADVVQGAAVTDALTHRRPGEQRYFRFPYNHVGATLEAKEAMEAFLAAHHYTIAPYTIDSADQTFNRVYVAARTRDDHDMLARTRGAYLDFVISATAFAEEISPRVVGRAIPQILLMHANDLNGDCLDELLLRLEARGYRFVTLDRAMQDPAYQNPNTLVTRGGPSWLWRWRQSLHLNVSFNGDPEPPAWIAEEAARLAAPSANTGR